MPLPRILILADRARPGVDAVVEELLTWLGEYADVVAVVDATDDPLPAHGTIDFAIVVGGDGTLIGQSRRIVDQGWPLLGVNVGRLGFLAEFDARSLRTHASRICAGAAAVHESITVHVDVLDAEGSIRESGVAVNDCVVTSGPPFRMIELRLAVDGAVGPTLNGDGVIVATPVGSTAYNVSAGGPILHPAVDAMVITPLAAHSLAFRTIVVPAEGIIELEVVTANHGTSVIRDGQLSTTVGVGERIVVRRHAHPARFIRHPEHAYWRTLIDKMRWAQPPNYRD